MFFWGRSVWVKVDTKGDVDLAKTSTPREPMRHEQSPTGLIFAALTIALSFSTISTASTRTLETRFALSADVRSEFSTRFPLPGAGRILVEAEWKSAAATAAPVSLTLVLIRPGGGIVARKSGASILALEYRTNEQELQSSPGGTDAKWTAKILNNADRDRIEVSGTLRITVPATSRVLEDTQFTLLGSGNAQEIPFNIPAPGRIDIDVSWLLDVASTPQAGQIPLTISLIHPGESKTYVRRQGASPVRFDHQVTDDSLDRGARWIIRVENDGKAKVKGRIKVTYNPSL